MEILIFVVSIIALFAIADRICKCCETCAMHNTMAKYYETYSISDKNEDDLK